MANFPTEFLFKRLSDFWDKFDDREDVKNVWDAYLRKANALKSSLIQADLSKSLKTIGLFDKNQFEYFIFPGLVRRTDLETNGPFYVYEIDADIFFIKNLNERIDDTLANRVLSPPNYFKTEAGAGADLGKTFIKFMRGVAPVQAGETFWTNGSDIVTGSQFTLSAEVSDIIQGQNGKFYKIIQVQSDTSIRIQGQTVFGEDVGPGTGAQTVYQLAATSLVIPSSVEVFSDGIPVSPANYTVTAGGVLTFLTAPAATVKSITVNYYLGYDGPTSPARRTVIESIPSRLFSTAVYRDRRSVFTNFGTAIGLDKPTSIQYLNEVRGIYFARYNGPTVANMALGGGILTDIPFSERGVVSSISEISPKNVIVGSNLIQIPDPLTIAVTAGQSLPRDFNLISDGIRAADFISAPDIFGLEPLKSDPAKFFTFLMVVKGSYAVFVATTTGRPLDYALLKKFANDIKPTYAKLAVVTDIDFVTENMNLFVGPVSVTNALDAAATLEFNLLNFAVIPEFLTVNGFVDEAALVASGKVDMDSDSVGLFETLEIDEVTGIYTPVAIDTLEQNMVNSGAFGGPPPDAMDDDSIPLVESLQLNEAVGTPPGSGNPPFTPGALIYTT